MNVDIDNKNDITIKLGNTNPIKVKINDYKYFDFSENKNILIPPYIVAKLKLIKKFDNFTWQYLLENMNEYKIFITDKSYI